MKTIDLLNQSIASDLGSRQFLNGIIYGDYAYESGKTRDDFIARFRVTPNNTSLFEYLTNKESSYNIKEQLGTYYVEDLTSDPSDTTRVDAVEEINKTEKRVITYTFEVK